MGLAALPLVLKAADVDAVIALGDRLIAKPSDEAAKSDLLRLANSDDGITRANVAAVIGRIGAGVRASERPKLAESLLPAVSRLLKDPDGGVRRTAAVAAGQYGADGKSLVADLAKRLQEGNNDVAWLSAEALGLIGPDARDAIPGLLESLRVIDAADADRGAPQLACYAATAIGQIGDGSPRVKEALVRALRDARGEFRVRCGIALMALGDSGDSGYKAIESSLSAGGASVCRTAVSLLLEMKGEESKNKIVALLRIAVSDSDASVRDMAVAGLKQVGDSGVQGK